MVTNQAMVRPSMEMRLLAILWWMSVMRSIRWCSRKLIPKMRPMHSTSMFPQLNTEPPLLPEERLFLDSRLAFAGGIPGFHLITHCEHVESLSELKVTEKSQSNISPIPPVSTWTKSTRSLPPLSFITEGHLQTLHKYFVVLQRTFLSAKCWLQLKLVRYTAKMRLNSCCSLTRVVQGFNFLFSLRILIPRQWGDISLELLTR